MSRADLSDEERRDRAGLTVSNHQGVYPVYFLFYVHAVYYAAERSQAAFNRFAISVTEGRSHAEIVASVHEALGHAAALSRFFFPPDRTPLSRARAATLRQRFAVGNGSPLFDRELRNALAHFDERLDEYLLGDMVGHIFPAPMVGKAGLADDPAGHIFRLVDPIEEIFVLLGRKHAFGPLRAEVDRIAAVAAALR